MLLKINALSFLGSYALNISIINTSKFFFEVHMYEKKRLWECPTNNQSAELTPADQAQSSPS